MREAASGSKDDRQKETAAVHITRGNLFLGLLPYFFESPQFGPGHSAADVADYVQFTSALVPLGCLCAPLVDYIIESLGFGLTAHLITLLGIVYSTLQCFSSMRLQVGTAVLFLIYRANIFAFFPTFAGRVGVAISQLVFLHYQKFAARTD